MSTWQHLEAMREVWRGDFLRFCDDVLYWRTGQGIEKWKGHAGQLATAKGIFSRDLLGRFRYKTVVLCWPKRQGKSTLAAAILAHSLVTGSNAHSVCCSNSRENAQTVTFDALLNFIRHSPILQALIPEGDRQKTVISCNQWGNWVRALPANENTVQGIAVTAGGWACFDDAHSAPQGVLDMVASQTEHPEARILVPSMMGSTRGYVYRLWEASKGRHGGHILFDYWHGEGANRNPYVSERWLAQRRSELPPAVYSVLHDNEPGEGGDVLFDADALGACREAWLPPQDPDEWYALCRQWGTWPEDVRLGAGIDRSLGRGDDTVFAVVARYAVAGGGEHYAVVWCEAIPSPTEGAILKRACRAREVFGEVRRCVAEIYQMADLAPKWGKALGGKAVLESASGVAQASAFSGLWQLVNEGRFHYSTAFEKLHEQLLSFQIDTDSGHLPRFSGGTGKAVDDYVYAVCWARVAASTARSASVKQVYI